VPHRTRFATSEDIPALQHVVYLSEKDYDHLDTSQIITARSKWLQLDLPGNGLVSAMPTQLSPGTLVEQEDLQNATAQTGPT